MAKNIWGKNLFARIGDIRFKLPKRFEIGLISFSIFMLFWADVAQNKFLDLGVNYKVSFWTGFSMFATTAFWIAIILYEIGLFSLILYSFIKKGTHFVWDWLVAIIAVFGLGIIMTGANLGVYTSDVIFFATSYSQVTFYHLFGILPQILAMFYFAFTE